MKSRIEPNAEIFTMMSAIKWLVHCGMEPPVDLPFQIHRASSINMAIESALDATWQDAGTAAQGELTGYLAKTDYDVYGTSWNGLGVAIETRIMADVIPPVGDALRNLGAERLLDMVLLDLTRIGLYFAYSKRFRRLPDFYRRLLIVYERGHLPCGWVGDLDLWPDGTLVVY